MKRIFIEIMVICIMFTIAGIAWSDIIHVPGNQPTIQAGIDAAEDGDTVLVADGTYTGEGNKNLDFKGKDIKVTSENGHENCIIDCEDDGRGFYFHSGETEDSVVSGFTITNGSVNNGGGIYCCDFSSPTIEDNIITGNSTQNEGGGIFCSDSSPTIQNNEIIGNWAGNNGGGMYLAFSSPKIQNNSIIGNKAGHRGGGIGCDLYSSPTIQNNEIIGNATRDGGGLNCGMTASPKIINNTISRNLASTRGGGIYCWDSSSVTVLNTIFWADSPDEIIFDASSKINITYSDIQGGWPGEGNIDADSLFVDPNNGDYHLQADSPCIGAGTPLGAPPDDLDGSPRDEFPDMGAYEYQGVGAGYFFLSVNPPSQTAMQGEIVKYTVTVTSFNGFNSQVDLLMNSQLFASVTPPAGGSIDAPLIVKARSASGKYPFTIQGTSKDGKLIHGVEAELIIVGVRVLIGFENQPGEAEEGFLRDIFGGKIRYTYQIVPAIAATIFGDEIQDLIEASQGFDVSDIVYVEPDLPARFLSEQIPWGIEKVNAEPVWSIGENRGQGVKVAILDTGVDYTHPDLDGNFESIKGYDFFDWDNEPKDDFLIGHGTHIAGIIAAEDNELGVVGVAPDARLYALRISQISDVIASIEWSLGLEVMQGGFAGQRIPGVKVDIVSMSFGVSFDPDAFPDFEETEDSITLHEACDRAYDGYENKSLLLIAAAGNDGDMDGESDTVDYPAQYESVIAVAAIDDNNQRAYFPAIGEWSSTGPGVELAAPGVNIESTFLNSSYAPKSGTSMACPYVTGAAALLIAAGITDANRDGKINDDVRERLKWSAEPIGREDWFGYGLVNAAKATDFMPPPPPVIISTDHPEGVWTNDKNLVFNWTEPQDMSGIACYSYELDEYPETMPPEIIIETSETTIDYSDRSDGTWYFHLRAKDNADNWSETSHYGPIKIDATPSEAPIITPGDHLEGVWTNNNNPIFNWIELQDMSGIASYSYQLDENPQTIPSEEVKISETTVNYSDVDDGEWYFHLRALDNAGNWSETSHYGPIKINTIQPAAPGGLSVVPGDAQVQLVWKANIEEDIAGYNVYRSTNETGEYSQISEELLTSPEFIDGGLTNGQTYWYKVSALDMVGNESEKSIIISVTPQPPLKPGLSISMSVDKIDALPGDVLTYTITYGNTGAVDATDVNISAEIPLNTSYVPDSISEGGVFDSGNNKVAWNISLLEQETIDRDVSFQVKIGESVDEDIQIIGVAQIVCADISTPVSSNSIGTIVIGIPDFAISVKQVPQQPTGPDVPVFAVTVTSHNGFNSLVNLGLTSTPMGAVGEFTPDTITPPANSSADSNLAVYSPGSPGTYTLTISGSSETLTHEVQITAYVTMGNTSLIQIEGVAYDINGNLAGNGFKVEVENVTKDITESDVTGSIGDSRYQVTFLNVIGETVATVGDNIRITVTDENGNLVGKTDYAVTFSDIAGIATIDVIVGGQFNLRLTKGINFISIPLKDERIKKLSDLAWLIGSNLNLLIWRDTEQSKFISYLPSFPEDSPANVEVTGSLGLIVVMEDTATVAFEGDKWDDGAVHLVTGINLIAVPVEVIDFRFSNLAAKIGADKVTMIIRYDVEQGKFISYLPTFPKTLPANALIRRWGKLYCRDGNPHDYKL